MTKDNPYRLGELVETLESINHNLLRDFGRFEDGRPNFRVVWSEDARETRRLDYTDEGFQLLHPEVREVRKYQHISERYVLEMLMPVVGESDLVTPTSYEPIWTFEDRFRNYLPPRFDACQVVIEVVRGRLTESKIYKKYNDETNSPEYRHQQVIDMEKKLFGDETPVGDALSHGDGISYAGMKTFTKDENNGNSETSGRISPNTPNDGSS